MNVIQIMGGLGNQLFQYAFGKVMERNNIDIAYDISFYGDLKDKPPMRRNKWPRYYRLGEFHTTMTFSPLLNQPTIKENNAPMDMGLLTKTNTNFHGYWQYPVYYKNIFPELRKDFRLKPDFCSEAFTFVKNKILDTPDSIAIHVRRGDYVFQKGFYNLPFKYYYEALLQVKGSVFIFSDDIPWCKEKFSPDRFDRDIKFIQFEDYQDFELMRSCKHIIMANSTLSYWAALLNETGTVVCPSGWTSGARELGQTEIMKEKDLIYYKPEWIKL